MLHRRDVLRSLGALSLAPGVQVLAAPVAVQQRLLVVFLRGAYDATHVLMPSTSRFYAEARPNLALAPPGSGPQAALALSTDWALHPALGPSLMPLWAARSLAFVPFTGLADASRSHFEMQDRMEFGLGMRASSYQSGFLNRLAAELPAVRAVSFTPGPAVILRGPVRVPNLSLLGRPAQAASDNERMAQQIAQLYEGSPLATTVQDGFATRDMLRQQLAMEMEEASRGAASPTGFRLVAQRLAGLLRDPYRLAFIDIGRWDTHVGQGAATGALAERLSELGAGLATLAQELGETWQHTTVVVMSEFGRTFRENGNRGTDHGHGSALWVLGGHVRGGRLPGEQVPSEPNHLHEQRDWPVLNDYRAVLAGVFARLYGLGEPALARIFPGVKPVDVGLI